MLYLFSPFLSTPPLSLVMKSELLLLSLGSNRTKEARGCREVERPETRRKGLCHGEDTEGDSEPLKLSHIEQDGLGVLSWSV